MNDRNNDRKEIRGKKRKRRKLGITGITTKKNKRRRIMTKKQKGRTDLIVKKKNT